MNKNSIDIVGAVTTMPVFLFWIGIHLKMSKFGQLYKLPNQ